MKAPESIRSVLGMGSERSGHRFALAAIIAIAMLAVILALVGTADDADAWSSTSIRGSSADFRTGYVRYQMYWESGVGNSYEYIKYNSYSPRVEYDYYSGSGWYMSSTRRAYMGFDISNWDERTYIGSGSITVYLYSVNSGTSMTLYTDYCDGDLHTMGASQVYSEVFYGTSVGTSTVTTSSTSFTYTLSSSVLSQIRTALANGEDYVYFGFAGSGMSSGEGLSLYYYNSYLNLNYDNSAPYMTAPYALPTYSTGSSVYVSWPSSADRPTSPNRGGVSYQVGVFTSSSSYDSPVFTTAWGPYTADYVTGLSDGLTYYIRVNARDASGFESGWSSYAYTTIDMTPPLIPMLKTEPEYTQGTTNTIDWMATTDSGSGVAYYQLQWAFDPDFTYPQTVTLSYTVLSTDVTRLFSGATYYYRVRAIDTMYLYSGWSLTQTSTQDADGPGWPGVTVPSEYSPMEPVTISWMGSVDTGVGMGTYTVFWSTNSTFSEINGSMANIIDNSFTLSNMSLLVSNTTMYFMVVSYDALANQGSYEMVNTTIDGDAPTVPVIDPLDEYSPGRELTLDWSASVDTLSGVDEYLVQVFARPGSGLVFSDTTNMTTMDIPALADGAQYWFLVSVTDMVANINVSVMETTTMDATPPTVPIATGLPQFSKGPNVDVRWGPCDDAGSGGIEYMVQWSQSFLFDIRVNDTEWMDSTDYLFMDMEDGASYWFRVKARDALGHESSWGTITSTKVINSPPPAVFVRPLDENVHGDGFRLFWIESEDRTGQPLEYQVVIYLNETLGSPPMWTSEWTSGMTMEVQGPGVPVNVTLYVRVFVRDLFRISNPSYPVTTFVDMVGPEAAVVEDLDAVTKGDEYPIKWTSGEDIGIGNIEHRVAIYRDEDLTSLASISVWTSLNVKEYSGSVEGVTYWFVVESRDGFGNIGGASEPVSTMLDWTPPTLTVEEPGFFGRNSDITGTVTDAVAGVDKVEASADGGLTWEEGTVDGSDGWSVDIGTITEDGEIWIRAVDLVGNVVMDYSIAVIDTTKPSITVGSPTEGEDISGVVVISGSIQDAHLADYIVEYQMSGDTAWEVLQPTQSTSGVSGTLATWVTAGLLDGEYTLRITATDALGQNWAQSVKVDLRNVRLSLGPSDISFSDTHPLPDEKVTVMVTVRNEGDSPAEDVTVTVYDGSKAIGEESGITVPAHGTYTVEVQTKADEGSSVYTARATSQLHDTGTMDTGTPLNTIEAESVLENAAGILALLALIVALIALLLIIMGKMGGKEEPAVEPEEDVIVDPIMEMEVLQPEPMPGEEGQGPKTF